MAIQQLVKDGSRNRYVRLSVVVAASLVISVSMMAWRSSSASAGRHRGDSQAINSAAAVRLRAIARNLAAVNGDAVPVSVSAVATSGNSAMRLATPGSFERTFASQSVFLITMVGKFKGYGLRVPANTAIPAGRFLYVIVSTKTYRVMAMSLGKASAVNPATIGRSVALTWK